MKRWVPFLIVAVVLGWGALAMACPMCKDSVPNNDGESAGSVPIALNISVYMLLGTFLAVLGLVSFGLFRAVQTTQPRPRDPRRGFPVDKPEDFDKGDDPSNS
jgi:hypothetical protein